MTEESVIIIGAKHIKKINVIEIRKLAAESFPSPREIIFRSKKAARDDTVTRIRLVNKIILAYAVFLHPHIL